MKGVLRQTERRLKGKLLELRLMTGVVETPVS